MTPPGRPFSWRTKPHPVSLLRRRRPERWTGTRIRDRVRALQGPGQLQTAHGRRSDPSCRVPRAALSSPQRRSGSKSWIDAGSVMRTLARASAGGRDRKGGSDGSKNSARHLACCGVRVRLLSVRDRRRKHHSRRCDGRGRVVSPKLSVDEEPAEAGAETYRVLGASVVTERRTDFEHIQSARRPRGAASAPLSGPVVHASCSSS